MNEIQSARTYSLQPTVKASSDVVASLIATLLASLHSADVGDAAEAEMANYLEILSQFEEPVLRKVIGYYRNGILGDGKFAPKAGEIANECRTQIAKDMKFQKEQEAIQAQIQRNKKYSDFQKSKTPESKARIQAKLEAAQKIIAQAKLEMEQEESNKRKTNIHEETHERYKSQGREALLNQMQGREAFTSVIDKEIDKDAEDAAAQKPERYTTVSSASHKAMENRS